MTCCARKAFRMHAKNERIARRERKRARQHLRGFVDSVTRKLLIGLARERMRASRDVCVAFGVDRCHVGLR
jgi:hypothetical protein